MKSEKKNNRSYKRKKVAKQKVADFILEFERELENLSDAEKAFVLRYLQTFNKRQAVDLAMPGHERLGSSASIIGTNILARPEVRRVVKLFFDRMVMDTVEISARFSHAATATMEDFLEVDEITGHAVVDFKKAKERGVLGMVKKAKFGATPNGTVYVSEFELRDAQDALNSLARINGMFTDNVKITADDDGENGPMAKMMKRMTMEKGKK